MSDETPPQAPPAAPPEAPPPAPPVWADSAAASAAPRKRSFAIASFVVALASVLGFWTGPIGAAVGVAAVVLAAVAFMRGERPGFAIAGLVLGIAGLALGLTAWAVLGVLDWMATINPSHATPSP